MNRQHPPHVRHSLSGLAHDAITLAELQCQLLAVDLRDARRGSLLALTTLGAGLIVGLACLPVLLIAAVLALIQFVNWPAYAACAAAGSTALAVAVCLAWVGSRKLLRSLQTVGRSRDEFVTTLRWFKRSLRPAATSKEFDVDDWRGPDALRPQHRQVLDNTHSRKGSHDL